MGLEALVLPEHWKMREGTFDLPMWDAVIVHNEYELLDNYSREDVCIDVGAHIGCFSWMALERGFGRLFAYEVEKDNHELLLQNLNPFNDRTVVTRAAVWRSDRTENVFLRKCPLAHNTGGHTLVDSKDDGEELSLVLPFDAAISIAAAASASGRIRLVKMDCEGSEFPILYTATRLDLIDEMVGEYHERDDPPLHVSDVGPFSMDELADHLRRQGFSVEHHTTHWSGLGMFRAKR